MRSTVRVDWRALAPVVAMAISVVGLARPYGVVTAEPIVSATVLGTLGGSTSQALDINEGGQVVGYSDTAGNAAYHAFSWTSAGGMIDLGTLGGTYSQAVAINDAGLVVGSSAMPGDAETHAFAWADGDGMVDLGTLGGTVSEASGVADDGRVTGYSFIAGDAAIHGFSWTQQDGMVDIGTLGGAYSQPNAGGANGRIVGLSGLSGDTANHAFVWSETDGMVDLGTLGGANSRAYAVNANGQVVGEAWTTGDAESHAFSWTQADGIIDLGTLGGTQSTSAGTGSAVNALGQVVGHSQTAGGDGHAFLWTEGDGMADLGTLGGTTSGAYALNDRGQVTGISFVLGGVPHVFWWSSDEGMIDLDALSGTDGSTPNAMNNDGTVVGWSTVGASMRGTIWTIGQPAGTDTDGDGIANSIDTSPSNPSSAFQDGSTTAGVLGAVPVGMTVTVSDAADPLGVHIVTSGTATGSVSIALTNPVSPGTPCGTVELASPAEVEVTCGSITVHALAGSAAIRLSDDTSLVVAPGETATISATGAGAFTIVSVSGGDGKVTVVGNGATFDVGPSAAPINLWDFVGFAAPVDNPPIVNTTKAGTTIPLKWRLLSETGAPITNLSAASVSIAATSCSTSATLDAIEELASSPSPLTNQGNGNYSLNWKTERSWTGCVQMRLKLAGEGPIVHTANFKFK